MSGPGLYWGMPGATAHDKQPLMQTYEDGYDAGYEMGNKDARYASAIWGFLAGLVVMATAFLGLT